MLYKNLWIFIVASMVAILCLALVPELNMMAGAKVSAYELLQQTGDWQAFIETAVVPGIFAGIGVVLVLNRSVI